MQLLVDVNLVTSDDLVTWLTRSIRCWTARHPCR